MPDEQQTAPQTDRVFFENEYVITVPLLIKTDKPSLKVYPPRFWIIACLTAVIALYGILGLITGILSGKIFYIVFNCGLSSLLIAVILTRTTVSSRSVYRHRAMLSGGKKWIRNLRFGETEITINDGELVWTFAYDRFTDIIETDETFYLCLKAGCFHVYKNSFKTGNADEFPAFVKEKFTALKTAEQLRVRARKEYIFAFSVDLVILAVILFLMIPPVVEYSKCAVPGYAAESALSEDLQIVETLVTPWGAVVFSADKRDNIFISIMKKSGLSYYYDDGHSYKITEVTEYNSYFGEFLFESREYALPDESYIVYGVTTKQHWDGLPKSAKNKYTGVNFTYEDKALVLYYKINSESL